MYLWSCYCFCVIKLYHTIPLHPSSGSCLRLKLPLPFLGFTTFVLYFGVLTSLAIGLVLFLFGISYTLLIPLWNNSWCFPSSKSLFLHNIIITITTNNITWYFTFVRHSRCWISSNFIYLSIFRWVFK